MLRRLLPSALFACLLCLGAATAEARRVPCADVLGALDRLSDDADGKPPEAGKVASVLKTDPGWVQRCARTYGRSVTMPPKVDESEPEDEDEEVEGDEPEELAPEEKKAGGDVYEGDVQDEKRRPRKFGEDAVEWQPSMQKPWDPRMPQEWEPTLLDDDL